MTALILAAGMGRRLLPLTERVPKPLITVVEASLLEHTIAFAKALGCHEVVIVTGYKHQVIHKFIESNGETLQMQVHCVYNPHFRFGSVTSLAAGLSAIGQSDDQLIILNADHMYGENVAYVIRQEMKSAASYLVCDFDRKLKKGDALISSDDHKHAVLEISKDATEFNGGYTGIAIINQIDLRALTTAVQAAASEDSHETPLSYEIALNTVTPDIIDFKIIDISGLGWVNVNTEAELSMAKGMLDFRPII
ncbi:MAG: sugar phosphate nucleotidyltransferase [bacterium]|nr:sugar phosphate nucleotidyltransferase [bacterium]